MSQPSSFGRMTAWPRLLTGKSSVTPWRMAVKIAWKAVMELPGGKRRPTCVSALDLASLVDVGDDLAETVERIGVGRRRTLRRGSLDDCLLALQHRCDDRLVGRSIARPGGVVLGEEVKALVADGERRVAA